MTWQDRGDLRADPGIAPGSRNIDPPKRRSIWPSIAVVAAAAAFGGVIWFAYQNGRDGARSGPPPLVKADAGPVKVKPDNPGGQEIPFQDSTVYDRLNQNGQKPVTEKLLPETEAPVERPQPQQPPQPDAAASVPPSPGTQATAQLPAALPQGNGIVVAPAQAPSPSPQAPPPQTAPPQTTPPTSLDASPTALAPQGTIITQPQPAAPRAITAPAPKPAPPAVAVKPAPAKAPTDSIAALINQHAAPIAPPPRPVAGSGYRIQLSAVRTPDAVSGEWARLKQHYPELASLKNATSKIDVPGKGTFYRVEAGPLDEAGAKSTCTHLRAKGLGCIVVKR